MDMKINRELGINFGKTVKENEDDQANVVRLPHRPERLVDDFFVPLVIFVRNKKLQRAGAKVRPAEDAIYREARVREK